MSGEASGLNFGLSLHLLPYRLCVLAAKALSSLYFFTGSAESSLLENAIRISVMCLSNSIDIHCSVNLYLGRGCDQVKSNRACPATESSWTIDISHVLIVYF